ncbi:MAG: trigger factor [Pseudomonadales bacterium]
MQISIETMSGLERRLTISVPSEAFEAQIRSRLSEAAQRVKLPGYRPGKVPLKEVRRRFGPSVRAEIAGELMQSSFLDAIRQEQLSPAGSPNLEVVKMDPGIDFEFTATFEVYPQVEVANLKAVTVRKPEAEITDADVDAMIDQLRDQRKDWVSVSRGAEPEDRVTLDFVGKIDDVAFEGGTGEDVTFEVGAGQMIEDFDQGVRGVAEGEEAEFTATFPEDYQAENLRGKTATFTVKVKKVESAVLPELDDEFFKAFGISEGGESAFRSEVRSNMQREMDAAASNQVKSQVMDQLHKLHTVQLPKAVVDREIEALKQQMMGQFQAYGQKAPEIDLPGELFLEQAERRVSVGLIVNEIVSKAGITPDADRVKARIETLAAGYAQPQQVVNYYYGNPEQLEKIEMAVLEDQVIDHILAKASVEIVPSTYTDIIRGTAVATDEDEAAPTSADPQSADPQSAGGQASATS